MCGVRVTHRGTRSKKGIQKRLSRWFAKRIILGTSFHDEELAETVARVDMSYRERIEDDVFTVHVEHGEVLLDKRARGTFQIMR